MKMLVSIIIPIYNTEQYLRKCLDSIKSQSYCNWECILVNDGSQDNSLLICQDYAIQDKRFKVINQENAGVSSARNAGLDAIQGEYVMFVDSDDWIEKNTIEVLIEYARQDCLVLGSYRYVYINQKKDVIYPNLNVKIQHFVTYLFKFGEFGYLGYITPKLFNTHIIKKFNLRFNKDIFYNEDRLFILQYILHCSEVVFSNQIVYNYVFRTDSATSLTKTIFSVKMITELHAFDIMRILLANNYSDTVPLCCYQGFAAACKLECNCGKYNPEIDRYKKLFFYLAYRNGSLVTKFKCVVKFIFCFLKLTFHK